MGCGHTRELHHDNFIETELICDGCENCNIIHSNFEDAPQNNKHIWLCLDCGIVYDNPIGLHLIRCVNCSSERVQKHKMCQCDGSKEFVKMKDV